MGDLFEKGGLLFMSLLTICLICVLLLFVINWYWTFKGKITNPKEFSRRLVAMKHVGFFAFILGILAQLISLFMAFKAIELETVEITSSLIKDGFKISLIPPSYGLVICLLAMALYYGLNKLHKTL